MKEWITPLVVGILVGMLIMLPITIKYKRDARNYRVVAKNAVVCVGKMVEDLREINGGFD